MPKGYFFFILIVVAGMMAYWMYFPDESKLKGYLYSKDKSFQFGAVFISDDSSGKANISVDIFGKSVDTPRPTYFHRGSCDSIGSIYFKYPLAPVIDGKMKKTLNVSTASIKLELPLVVTISQNGIYTACAEIK